MKEKAVSDIIAAILLIGVVTASLGIVGVMLTRDIIPNKIPQFNFQTCINTTDATISLYHTGGETLRSTAANDEFVINLLDKNKQSLERAPLIFQKGSWAVGENITIKPGLNPTQLLQVKYLQIISTSGRGDNLVSWSQTNDCSPEGYSSTGKTCLGVPYAAFTTSSQSGPSPLTVTFTDTSHSDDDQLPVTNGFWDFDDGNTYPLVPKGTITHTFYDSGKTYNVRLYVQNKCGTDSVRHSIATGSPPCTSSVTSKFTTTPAPYGSPPSLTLHFINQSTSTNNGPLSFLWKFGDGSYSTDENPDHTFSQGIYYTSLNVTDSCGTSDTSAIQVSVVNDDDCTATANFEANLTKGKPPLTILFTDKSSATHGTIESWSWEFGDGLYSTDENPEHTYIVDNNYQVNLTITTSCGKTSSTSLDISVNSTACSAVSASFTPNTTSGDAPLSVAFTDSSTGGTINAWQWNFGDGSANETTQNPIHTFTSSGTFQVYLTATNTCDRKATTGKTITVTCPSVSASFTPNTTSGDAPLTVSFTDLSSGGTINAWQWNFGDGSANETTQNPIHTFTSSGTFQVYLTTTNACGNKSTTGKAITVTCPTVSASFTPNTTSGNLPLTVLFTDSSSGGVINEWQWNFGDGTANITTRNPIHIFTSIGTFQVYLTANNTCGNKATVMQSISVNCPPVSTSFTPNTTSGSLPLTVSFTDSSTGGTINTWQWNFGDGSANATTQNPTHTFTSTGTFQVYLTTTNTCGNKATTGRTITVTCPSISASFTPNTTSGNAPLTVLFTDSSTGGTINTWQWNFGDGSANATTQNPTHTFTSGGTFQVYLTTTNTCGNKATTGKTITVTCPAVSASFSPNTTSGNAPLTVLFTDSSTGGTINTWQWNFGDGSANATTQNPTHTFTSGGTFQVFLTTTNTCGNKATTGRTIIVSCPSVSASFTPNPTSGNAPLTVLFTDSSTGGTINSWQWDFGDGTANVTTQNPTHTFTSTGTFQVYLTATNTCGNKATIGRTITVTCPAVLGSFTRSPSSGNAPLTVAFTDSSTGGTINSWQWDFGDGTANVTTQNPTHRFARRGWYTVILTASNSCGNSGSYSSYVYAY